MNWIKKYFRKKPKVDFEERVINKDFFEDLENLLDVHLGVSDKVYARKYINEHFKGRGIDQNSYEFVCKKSVAGYFSELGYESKSGGDGRIERWGRMEKTILESQMRAYEESMKNKD